MTLDYEDPDEIVLGKDLKAGDCIRSFPWSERRNGNAMGIIVSTTFHDSERGKELKRFYSDKSGYEMYDINCPSEGPYSSRLDPEHEFKVIRSRKDILYTYRTIEYRLLSRSADLMQERNELVAIKSVAVDNMNDRLDKIKKELKE